MVLQVLSRQILILLEWSLGRWEEFGFGEEEGWALAAFASELPAEGQNLFVMGRP